MVSAGNDVDSTSTPEPSSAGNWYNSPKKLAAFVVALISVIAGLITIGQFWPVAQETLVPKEELTEEIRAELRAWAREAAVDGTISGDERSALTRLTAGRRLDAAEIDAYRNEIEEPIGHSADLVRQGLGLIRRGEFSAARDRFLQATSLDPDNVRAWVNLGAASLELGLLKEAEAELRRGLELDPDRWTTHYNLGASLASRGREEVALGHLERSLELAGQSGLSPDEKQSVRRDLAANRWLEPLREMPRFEALLAHGALETRGI